MSKGAREIMPLYPVVGSKRVLKITNKKITKKIFIDKKNWYKTRAISLDDKYNNILANDPTDEW